MLLTGIPAFRLPRALVRQEIAALLSLGIELVTHCRIGVDKSFDDLLAAHERVLLTVGCARGRQLPVPGGELPGVIRAVDFLREFNADTVTSIVLPALIVGGGSVAFDAARSAQRLAVLFGDASANPLARAAVQLVAPEALESLPVPVEELHEARLEGVVVRAGSGVRRIEAARDGLRVVVAPVASLHDEQGRFRPTLQEGRDETFEVGTVILAVGQQSDVSFLSAELGLSGGGWGGVVAGRDGRTSHPRIFAAGDLSSGPGDLIDAIASGKRAAHTIRQELSCAGPWLPAPGEPIAAATGQVSITPLALERRYYSGYDIISRRELPVLPVVARAQDSEVEEVLTLKDARREASRCLLCDTHIVLDAPRCIACALCVDVCPYGCISLAEVADGNVAAADAGRFALTLDETACIRCGLCVDRCPPHALDLIRV